jgi:ABC-2 type transport system permease protein
MSTMTLDVSQTARVPFGRLVSVELRKMFDTRAGRWLLISIAAFTALVLVIQLWVVLAQDLTVTFNDFAGGANIPMTIGLPVLGAMSVTSEWSQRTGLTTFTLVPHRGRVIWAKALVALAVGVVSVFVALAIGALGNVVGTTINGTTAVWDISVVDTLLILLGQVLGLLGGFMLGVLIRNSAGAIVGYFVYSLVLPVAFGTLAAFQEWFRDLQPWVDVNFAVTRLFDQTMTAEYWQQLGVSTLVWLWIPLAIGLRAILRAEVK